MFAIFWISSLNSKKSVWKARRAWRVLKAWRASKRENALLKTAYLLTGLLRYLGSYHLLHISYFLLSPLVAAIVVALNHGLSAQPDLA